MKKNKRLFLIIMVFLFSMITTFYSSESRGGVYGKITFAIVFPGGPDSGTEGKKIITQFLDILTKQTTLLRSSIDGEYFNTMSGVDAYLRANKNTFIMGSLGFFLANQKKYNLVPLSLVSTETGPVEQYYIMVKKGGYKSLADLKGKVLSGNVLYEDARYINRMIFNNLVDISKDFKLQPTPRPLSAVRKINTGGVDAVLINQMQYLSLKKIPSTFQNLEVIYKSPDLPRLGFMMIDSSGNSEVKDEILKAIVKMTALEEGKKVCENFGITGFQNLQPEKIDEAIAKFNSAD
jgi:ABC-type phosphate/phosphonate transport system substrate-binding protein